MGVVGEGRGGEGVGVLRETGKVSRKQEAKKSTGEFWPIDRGKKVFWS